jgi:hypothetical protein
LLHKFFDFLTETNVLQRNDSNMLYVRESSC